MSRSFLALAVALTIGFLTTTPAHAVIQVGFSPESQVVDIADGTATVDILADIPEADAIIGWGLDVTLSGTSVSLAGPPAINNALFNGVFAPDGDGLAALVPLGDLHGNDIVLATLTLSLDGLGTTDLALSDSYPTDLSEGFPQMDGYAEVSYFPGSITVVPEPASLVLMGVVAGGVLWRRRR